MFKYLKKIPFYIPVLLIVIIGFVYSHFVSSPAEASHPSIGLAGKPQPQSSVAQVFSLSSDSNTADNLTLRKLTDKLRLVKQELKSQQLQNTRLQKKINNLSDFSIEQEVGNEIICAEEMKAELLSTEEMKQEEALITQKTELFEHTLSEEPVDTEQSQKLTAEVDGLLESNAINRSTLLDVECGLSLCRVTIQHQDVDAQDAFINISPMILELRGDSFTALVDYGDGTKTTILYLSRMGFSLPDQEKLDEG